MGMTMKLVMTIALAALAVSAAAAPLAAATNTDAAARADAAALFQTVTTMVEDVSASIEGMVNGQDARSAERLRSFILVPLEAAIDEWDDKVIDIGMGAPDGNHYATYSDCQSAAHQLVYLTKDVMRFHEGRIAADEMKFSHADILIAELKDCGEALSRSSE